MARQKMRVDYHGLSRRELQNLCKKHGIPANKTNVQMADALASLLKGNRQNCFVSTTPSPSLDDDENKCILSDSKMQNRKGNRIASNAMFNDTGERKIFPETELEGTEEMEEGVPAAVKDAHLEELVEVSAQEVIRKLCDATTGADEGNFVVHQVKSDSSADCEELGQEERTTNKRDAEDLKICSMKSSPCADIIETDSQKANSYTGSKESSKYMEPVVSLSKVGYVQVDASLLSTGGASPKSKQEETTTGKDCPDKTAEATGDTMVVDLPATHADVKGLIDDTDVSNNVTEVADMIVDSTVFTSHESQEKLVTVDTESNNDCMKSDYSKGLSQKEYIPAADNKNAQSCGVFSQTPLCGRDELLMPNLPTANTALEPSDTEPSNSSLGSSFQFFVECDNGIKLFVDLKNNSPIDWMKTWNYEFSLPQELHGHKPYEQNQLKSRVSTNNIVAEKKINSTKLADSHPQATQTICSPSAFQRQKISAGDCLSGSSNKNGLVASTSPWILTNNLEAPREHRCTSSVLIPPRRANKGLSPLIFHNASRLSSPFISSCKLSRFSSPSSQAYASEQRNKSSDSFESGCPVTSCSKAVEHSCVRSKATQAENPFCVEAAAELTPVKGTRHDMEMRDQELCNAFMKTSKNELDREEGALSQGEVVVQSKEKVVQRTSQMHDSQDKLQEEEVHCTSLMNDFQDEGPRIISRHKDDYKKSPFIKNLRTMKNLARASTMRADVLARKRAIPLMEKSSTYHHPSSKIQSVHSLSQSAEVSTLRGRGEIVNGHPHPVPVSPRVYCEGDVCVLDVRSDREPPVTSSSVYREENSTQNVGHAVSSSTHLGLGIVMTDSKSTAREDTIKGSAQVAQSKKKISAWPFAESGKGTRAQKMLQLEMNGVTSAQGKVSDKVLRSCARVGHGNQNGTSAGFLQELNLPSSAIFVSEPNLYNARVTERQRRHQEHFKTSLTGKSREKAMKIAKQMALVQRSEIIKSKRGIALTN